MSTTTIESSARRAGLRPGRRLACDRPQRQPQHLERVAQTLASVIPGVSLDQGHRMADQIHNSGQAIVWWSARAGRALLAAAAAAGLTMAPLERGSGVGAPGRRCLCAAAGALLGPCCRCSPRRRVPSRQLPSGFQEAAVFDGLQNRPPSASLPTGVYSSPRSRESSSSTTTSRTRPHGLRRHPHQGLRHRRPRHPRPGARPTSRAGPTSTSSTPTTTNSATRHRRRNGASPNQTGDPCPNRTVPMPAWSAAAWSG